MAVGPPSNTSFRSLQPAKYSTLKISWGMMDHTPSGQSFRASASSRLTNQEGGSKVLSKKSLQIERVGNNNLNSKTGRGRFLAWVMPLQANSRRQFGERQPFAELRNRKPTASAWPRAAASSRGTPTFELAARSMALPSACSTKAQSK